MDTDDLMQPGNTRWQDEASCNGDERFINPDKIAGLKLICKACPVYKECSKWAVGQSGVFAAGSWREQEDIEPWHGQATGGSA